MSHTLQHTAPVGVLPANLAEHGDDLGLRPFRFEHGISNDPRFSADRIAELVPRLPCAWVLAHRAQYSPHERRGKEKLPPDTDLERAIRELPTSAVSIRAYNLEHTTDFHPIVESVEPAVRSLVGSREGGLATTNLATFAASAGAVTAAHPDRHHNLLLNLHGHKEVWIGDEIDTRRHHVRTLDYFRFPAFGAPELPPARMFTLGPGEGVYIPPYAWHWTKILGDGALGFSIGFSTPASLRNVCVVAFDMKLRRLGVRPRPLDPSGEELAGRVKARLSPLAARAAGFRVGSRGPLLPSADAQEVAR